jgi:ribosomal protein S18 acetylase RimI-like enzyme
MTAAIVITEERADAPDTVQLLAELDAVLTPLYAPESRHGFTVEKLVREGVPFFVTRVDGIPAGCGGVKLFQNIGDDEYGEIKRMYVRPQFRGMGLSRLMLNHLADYTRQHGIPLLRLETGIYQTEAIGLYESFGFRRISPFGEYFDDPVSLCYEIRLEMLA